MTLSEVNHPCFNVKARKKYGRVHLPVAPRCNIQCKFCNRKFDCVNESRPGVSSGILSPYQALVYLEHVFEARKNIAVVGIAGPGDPFANAAETLETMALVRAQYPDIILCVATNGLGLPPHLDRLVEIGVGHVTVTVNAVDTAVAEEIYSWVRWGKRALRAREGVKILLDRQLAAIEGLKARGITVKVNAILIPGVNDHHIPEVARATGDLGVDIFNCLPYHKAEGCAFGDMAEPSAELLARVRRAAGRHVKQMTHCRRCRADAAGCLGERADEGLMRKLKACEAMPKWPDSSHGGQGEGAGLPMMPDSGADASGGTPHLALEAVSGATATDDAPREGATGDVPGEKITGGVRGKGIVRGKSIAVKLPGGGGPAAAPSGGMANDCRGPGGTGGGNGDLSRVAVASLEGVLVNQHLGEASHLRIYEMENGRPRLVERRRAPERGTGALRWQRLSRILSDCSTLLVSGIGAAPRACLEGEGMRVHVIEGVIEDAVAKVLGGGDINHLIRRESKGCGMACGGTGGGCG